MTQIELNPQICENLPDGHFWPDPIGMTDMATGVTAAKIYRGALSMFLDTDWLPTYPLTESTLLIFDALSDRLFQEKRWKDYYLDDAVGDANLLGHHLRQGLIGIQALYYDTDLLHPTVAERDIIVSTDGNHDFGELITTDLTHDVKHNQDKHLHEIIEAKGYISIVREAAIKLGIQNVDAVVEAYLRVATGLNQTDIVNLIGEGTHFTKSVRWDLWRRLFKTYEGYGYMITGMLHWPFPLSTEIRDFTDEESYMLQRWNRTELDEALKTNTPVPEDIRAAILLKNVLGNIWPVILEAFNTKLPSVEHFFLNKMTYVVLTQAKELYKMDLDLSVFGQTGNMSLNQSLGG